MNPADTIEREEATMAGAREGSDLRISERVETP
jgi:hypothetical protein